MYGLHLIKTRESSFWCSPSLLLKAELSKYSDIFNVKETQELVQEVVSSVTKKTLTDWINTNMDRVVKKSVKEELAKIAQNKASAKK